MPATVMGLTAVAAIWQGGSGVEEATGRAREVPNLREEAGRCALGPTKLWCSGGGSGIPWRESDRRPLKKSDARGSDIARRGR
jgi:hypothetical protein